MRIIFMGSPDFAVPSLEELHQSRHQVIAVVTQPDRPFGRRLHMHSPPIKLTAQALGIPVLQPATTRTPEFVQEVEALRPDLLAVVAYGEILRPALLRIPPLGAVNLHASLLPKYRGAAPVAWAILNGETQTGCTTMQINQVMDAGDMYLQKICGIDPDDTTATLTSRLSRLGAPLLKETLDRLEQKEIQAVAQDSTQVTFAPKLKKENGLIDWSRSADRLSHQTRAFDPWPGSFSHLHGRQIKIWRALPSAETTLEPPGTVILAGHQLHVACGERTVLQILELQQENRPRIKAADFVNGVHLKPGQRFDAL